MNLTLAIVLEILMLQKSLWPRMGMPAHANLKLNDQFVPSMDAFLHVKTKFIHPTVSNILKSYKSCNLTD